MSVSTGHDKSDTRGLARPGASLRLRGLTCSFGGAPVVNGVDLDVEPGEFVSLLGPSGSGKTTTLMMIAGFQHPVSGTISMDDRELSSTKPQDRDIGVVFQSYALFPHMSVAQNVAYPLRIRGVSKAETAERVGEVLDLVRLPLAGFGDRRPFELSGGQQQRVAMARALVFQPRVLLMDEPMGALDKGLRADLQAELKALHSRVNVTVVYVTHDQEEAMFLSDRIALFDQGEIVQIGTPNELYTRPRTPFVARFLGDVNIIAADAATLPEGLRSRLAGRVPNGGGQPTEWMVRPEHVHLVDDESALLHGKVQEVTYLGSTLRVVVDTEVGRLAARLSSDSFGSYAPGDPVGVAWAEHSMTSWAE